MSTPTNPSLRSPFPGDAAQVTVAGFVPPPYPYERLDDITALAHRHDGGAVDLSIGTPIDPPPEVVLAALADPDAARGYPASIGTPAYRGAVARWLERRFGVSVDPASEIAAVVGTKEFVASTPQYLRLRDPSRDTVLYPAISYPTYEMGATLAGARAVPYRNLGEIDPADAARALCIWVNSPANPTGELLDLDAAARWGREQAIPVLSDECYAEFTWSAPAATVLRTGTTGVLAVHSLSKRDNFAGARIGSYAGDPELVHYLREVRKHAGLMPAGPVQAAAVLALDDDEHVDLQRTRYLARMHRLRDLLWTAGYDAELPAGAFYLWVPAPDGDAWAAARDLAIRAGIVVSPGEFYGSDGAGHFRVAAVAPEGRIELAASRLATRLDG
jgi:succinyldiaminopimelate transaminase